MTVDSGRDVPAEVAPLPRISVALGTYNGERFLRQQLESIARQRVLPTELVVCDDCSSDGTMAILEDFARNAPFPVRIFRNDSNLGFTANFIGAADRCQGPLVAFCDQDDVWSESKIEVCATFFADHPAVRLLLHAAQPVDERLRPVGNAYPPVSSRGVVPALGADPWQVAPGCMIVFDKAVLDLADWRERPLSRDLNGCPMDFDEWLYFLALSIGELGFIDDRLIQYRQHGKNLFGAPTPGWLVRLRKLLNEDFATHAGRAAVARSYAAFLERTSQAPAPEDAGVQEQLAAGARFWRAYEQLSRQRDAFYDAESFRERLRRLRKLVASGAYKGRETGRLGRLALARDLRELVRPGRGVDSATNAVGSA